MEHSRNGMKVLLFLTLHVHISSAVTHSLQYLYTVVTPGINFPEFTIMGRVDGEEFEYYDSDNKTAIPKTEWIQKFTVNKTDYWKTLGEIGQFWQEKYKTGLSIVMKDFNHTTGVHTGQYMTGCELDDDGTARGYVLLGYDGEDFLSLDLKTRVWIPAKHGAVISEQFWDYINGLTIKGQKNEVNSSCIQAINQYVSYGREILEKKGVPEVSVFQKHSPIPEVVCHATGFFPRAVMISWQKDGEDVYEDVELRETLPNQDGSFQKRNILKVPAEELQKHTYTCVVQHSSLEKELVREVPKDGGSDGGSGGSPIAIITAVVVTLITLIAVVAGIVVWKKKNSGFGHVQLTQSSEGDSSSNNL